MKNNTSNIDLSGTDFPRRLRELREQRRYSKADLAERADLSYRTIHDLESGRRDRVLEKTLMLLATALGVRMEELLERYRNGNGNGEAPAALPVPPVTVVPVVPPAARATTWRRVITVVGVVVAVVVAVGFAAWRHGVTNATWEVDGGTVIARDAYLGAETWRLDTGSPNVMCGLAPWSDDELLVAVRRRPETGGPLLCLDRASGRQLWEMRPDLDAVIAAFGEEDVLAATMNCLRFTPADLDADGEPEVIAEFVHGLYYPYVLCRVDRHGRLMNQYANKGHIYGSAVVDLDDDGKQEVVAVGTNNSKAYQGATLILLDDEHFRGASVDSLTDAWSSEPDSALVRVVLPHFCEPFQGLTGEMRLGAFNLDIHHDGRGRHEVNVTVGASQPGGRCLIVTVDEELRPVRADISDAFLERINNEWPDSLKNGKGPADAGWRQEWLAGHVRFEAGHWPR